MSKRQYRREPSFEIRMTLPIVREANNVRVRTPSEVYALCSDIAQLGVEVFQVVILNTKNYVIDRLVISSRTLDGSLVHPREVFRAAVVGGGAAIVLVHNHPSGDPTPSAEDLRITRQLVEAGRVLGINVMDHIILGRPSPDRANAWVSLRETGMIQFG